MMKDYAEKLKLTKEPVQDAKDAVQKADQAVEAGKAVE